MGAGILFAQAKPLSKVDFQKFLLIPEDPWKLFDMEKKSLGAYFSSIESVLVMCYVHSWASMVKKTSIGLIPIID
jgi:hypothetical protein